MNIQMCGSTPSGYHCCMRQTLILTAVWCAPALAADLCPHGGDTRSGAKPGLLEWKAFSKAVAKERRCVAHEVRNLSNTPQPLVWKKASIEAATLSDSLEVAMCCFAADQADMEHTNIQVGKPPVRVPAIIFEVDPEEEEEGFPDL